ncbi:MAG: HIT domain-containing protein [Nanoarchaeota archaeon]|nr:HIT domain-containing protein [Nanoarchaeota archaeon]
MPDNCIFCKVAKKEIPPKHIEETNNFFVIPDKFPKAEGHILIIPKKHYVTILDIPNTLSQELMELIKKMSNKILEKKQGDGFNILMNNLPPAGQSFPHAHIHLIPRKDSDGLRIIS